MLVSNIKGYKTNFKSKQRIIEELNNSLDKIEKESNMTKSQFKGVYTLTALSYVAFYAIFYVIVWAYSDNLLMTILSVLMMGWLLYDINPLLDAVNNRKYKISWTRFIETPLKTVYILLFIYFIF